MIRAVLFDWGGTLSTYTEVDLLAMWRAAAEVLAPNDPQPLAAQLLAAEDQWWRTRVREGGGDASGTTEQLVRSVEARTRLPVQQAIEAYHGAWEATVSHDPAAAEVLQGCLDRGWRTGLLSNTHWPRAVHDRWLADAGLLDLLQVRVYTSDLAHMKPHAQTFRTLLEALEVEPADAVFVGDRPHDDISGAQAVGMRTVLLSGRPVPDHEVIPDAQIPWLSSLLDVLDSW